jgi:hypothetical protein
MIRRLDVPGKVWRQREMDRLHWLRLGIKRQLVERVEGTVEMHSDRVDSCPIRRLRVSGARHRPGCRNAGS